MPIWDYHWPHVLLTERGQRMNEWQSESESEQLHRDNPLGYCDLYENDKQNNNLQDQKLAAKRAQNKNITRRARSTNCDTTGIPNLTFNLPRTQLHNTRLHSFYYSIGSFRNDYLHEKIATVTMMPWLYTYTADDDCYYYPGIDEWNGMACSICPAHSTGNRGWQTEGGRVKGDRVAKDERSSRRKQSTIIPDPFALLLLRATCRGYFPFQSRSKFTGSAFIAHPIPCLSPLFSTSW